MIAVETIRSDVKFYDITQKKVNLFRSVLKEKRIRGKVTTKKSNREKIVTLCNKIITFSFSLS